MFTSDISLAMRNTRNMGGLVGTINMTTLGQGNMPFGDIGGA